MRFLYFFLVFKCDGEMMERWMINMFVMIMIIIMIGSVVVLIDGIFMGGDDVSS